jgi:hypothetical protein
LVRGNRILQIAEDHIHLWNQFRDLGANLRKVWWNEVDHAFEAYRKLPERLRCPGRKRLEEMARQLHGQSPSQFLLLHRGLFVLSLRNCAASTA